MLDKRSSTTELHSQAYPEYKPRTSLQGNTSPHGKYSSTLLLDTFLPCPSEKEAVAVTMRTPK